jgi:hypothetical protein
MCLSFFCPSFFCPSFFCPGLVPVCLGPAVAAKVPPGHASSRCLPPQVHASRTASILYGSLTILQLPGKVEIGNCNGLARALNSSGRSGGNFQYIILQVNPHRHTVQTSSGAEARMSDTATILYDLPSKGQCACWSLNPWKSKSLALSDPILHLLM